MERVLQAMRFGRPRIANGLILRIGLLILVSLAVFAAASHRLILLPTAGSLAEAQMGLVSEQLEARVARLLQTVEATLRSSRGWGMNGDLDHSQLPRFNEFFFPVIANHGEINSVIFADETGREILLLRTDEGKWLNRISNPAEWGRRTYWLTWNAERQLESVELRELDYDARQRPWFIGAMRLADDGHLHWTEPYVFFTSRQPGITAAGRWTAKDGRRFVIAHDVHLYDLSAFTATLQAGRRGKAALFQEDGRLVALPRDESIASPDAIRASVLKTPAELGLMEVAEGLRAWQADGRAERRMNRYRLGDTRWFSLFRPVQAGDRAFWLGVFAAEEDFLPGTREDVLLLAGLALLVLLAGVVVAVRIARQFARPLSRLARESVRIGRMELEDPVRVQAPWLEVNQLAAAQEGMRQRLQEAQHTLLEANTALERKVTERTRELEESRRDLQEREAFFRAIIENAVVGISRLDTDRRRQMVNRAFAEFTGYGIAELLAGTGLDLIAPDDRQRIAAAYDDLLTGRSQRFRTETEFVRKDGDHRWADVQLTAIRADDGKVASLLATVLDVTDRRTMERELERQFALLQALIDTIPNPIFYKGADSRFIGCNTAYEQAFAVDRRDFIGKRVLDLEYLPEADRRAYQAEDETVISRCGRVSRDTSMVFSDGQTHDALYSVTGFPNPDGSPGGLVGLIVDITPLKEAEREARNARAAAEAAAAAKADFLANMSHEIRTPMNAIMGMTHLALQTPLSPRQKNYLEKVDAAAQGLLRIINDILDFSKLEAGMMRTESIEFSLDEVMRQLADMAILRAREKGLELLFDVAPDVPRTLVGDPLRLGQVLLNLVGNALKFTEVGEVSVAVRLESGPEEAPMLRFEVADTGIGMTEAEVGRLFGAFSQADTSTTRRYGGTGLGLSICKRIVELMGGGIGVESVPGSGSRFRFTIRFGLAGGAASPASPPPPDGLRVLVVDDNASARELFAQMLGAMSLDCAVVGSGPEALAELRRADDAGRPYGLLVADWQMPGMDGVETVRRLRAEAAIAATPAIVMTTAYDREELAEALGNLTVGAVLPKPVTPSALFDAIAEALHADGRAGAAVKAGAGPDAGHDLAGLRVLLVEDNAVNQELAVELMSAVGISATVAGNGAEALALAASREFDAIVMDCHMPVMDGFEATRRLRADPRHRGLPIIAMTAGALAGDRERCLAVGMSDYLSKPVAARELYAKLAGVTGRRMPPGHKAAGGLDHAGERVLDPSAALERLDGNGALYRRLLERFRQEQPAAIERLRADLEGGDDEASGRTVHTLKGLAGNIGAARLARRSRALEEALSAGGDRAAQWQSLAACFADTLVAIDGELASVAAPDQPAETGKQDLGRSLADLHALLLADDASAVRCLEPLLPLLDARLAPGEADRLARMIKAYDFGGASSMLRQLAGRLAVHID